MKIVNGHKYMQVPDGVKILELNDLRFYLISNLVYLSFLLKLTYEFHQNLSES